MEFSLLGAALVAVGGVYAALWWEGRRGNAAECTADLWDTAIGAVLVGVAVGRLAAMVRSGVNPLTAPGDILIIRSGVDTGPASLAAIATVAWRGRRELWLVGDGLAVGALAGLAGWHGACMLRSACLGAPSDLPWAMTLSGSTIGRHPVEIYAAVAFGAAAVTLAVLRQTGRWPAGAAAGFSLAAAGGIRLATEPLRPSLTGGPVWWYVAAIVAGVLALATRRRR